jgi:hypothetical protein
VKRILNVLLLVAMPAVAKAQPHRPVTWVVSSNAAGIAGRSANVILTAKIDKDWHVYALSQKPGGPKALEISLAPNANASFASPIIGPKPDTKFDKEFGMVTQTYSGKARFRVPLRISSSAPRDVPLQIKIRYQTCNATMCFPPTTITLATKLTVKKSA